MRKLYEIQYLIFVLYLLKIAENLLKILIVFAPIIISFVSVMLQDAKIKNCLLFLYTIGNDNKL